MDVEGFEEDDDGKPKTPAPASDFYHPLHVIFHYDS